MSPSIPDGTTITLHGRRSTLHAPTSSSRNPAALPLPTCIALTLLLRIRLPTSRSLSHFPHLTSLIHSPHPIHHRTRLSPVPIPFTLLLLLLLLILLLPHLSSLFRERPVHYRSRSIVTQLNSQSHQHQHQQATSRTHALPTTSTARQRPSLPLTHEHDATRPIYRLAPVYRLGLLYLICIS